MKKIYILLFISILSFGCGHATELVRTTWGSSTRALEKARSEGESGIFKCSLQECFTAVEGMTVAFGQKKDDDQFVLFARDRQQRYMVIMGVVKAVDTTEVGVFFDEKSDGRIQVEIASLSSRAKAQAARMIFGALESRFGMES